MRPWVTLKFGGTSVASPARWATISAVLEARIRAGERPLVVCSALSGVSNLLTALADDVDDAEECDATLAEIRRRHVELASSMGIEVPDEVAELLADLARLCAGARMLGEASPRFRARVMSAGELMSTRLGAAFLRKEGVDVVWADSRQCLTAEPPAPSTPEGTRYLSATCGHGPDPELDIALRDLGGDAVLVQGFIASDEAGDTVLLGRGGSDTSAAYFAGRLGATRLEIWTDVPGIFTTNPHDTERARLLERVGYEEALTMASLGAGVLHPRSIEPVRDARIPLMLCSTPRPETRGTTVVPDDIVGDTIKVVTTRRKLAMFSIKRCARWQEVGTLAELTGRFRDHGLSIDLLTSSPSETRLTVDPSASPRADELLVQLQDVLSEVGEVSYRTDVGSVSVVGSGVLSMLHELGPALDTSAEFDVLFVDHGACGGHVTFVLPESDVDAFAAQVHDELFVDRPRPDLGPSWAELTAIVADAPAARPAG